MYMLYVRTLDYSPLRNGSSRTGVMRGQMARELEEELEEAETIAHGINQRLEVG